MSSPHDSIRIVIADRHPVVLAGLRKLIDPKLGLVIVGEASDRLKAIQLVHDLAPDVLLIDPAMPGTKGAEILAELRHKTPSVKTVLMTDDISGEQTVEALKLGARGVIAKDSTAPLLCKCLRVVAAGEFWIGRDRVRDLVRSLLEAERLDTRAEQPAALVTPRELQVIAAIVDGATNKDVATQLGVSAQTVKNHLSNIFDKLGVSNRLELALYAAHHRLLQGAEDRPKIRQARAASRPS
ncbi:MAG: response regulator transcription factor [Acidobacteriota bacterium]